MNEQEYAGFWIRVGASTIDTILVAIIFAPILTVIYVYGTDYWGREIPVQGTWNWIYWIFNIVPAVAVIMFWIYKSATPRKMVTNLIMVIIIAPILTVIYVYGTDYWGLEIPVQGPLNWIFNIVHAVAVIMFWIYKSATPGKMVTNLIIVDATTGGKPSNLQFIGRYFSYIISSTPFFLGFIWVAIDKRKQGWHDKLVGTVVIRNN